MSQAAGIPLTEALNSPTPKTLQSKSNVMAKIEDKVYSNDKVINSQFAGHPKIRCIQIMTETQAILKIACMRKQYLPTRILSHVGHLNKP